MSCKKEVRTIMANSAPVLLALIALFAVFPASGYPEDTSSTISFGILFADRDPIAGSATCYNGKTCELVKDIGPIHSLSITDFSKSPDRGSQLKIECASDCSFGNQQFSTEIGRERNFHFFNGSDTYTAKLLVIRIRNPIGQILLNY